MHSQSRSIASIHPPVYHAGAKTYHIDDCAPQLEAIREGRVRFRGYSNGFYPGDPIDARTITLKAWQTPAGRAFRLRYLHFNSIILHHVQERKNVLYHVRIELDKKLPRDVISNARRFLQAHFPRSGS